MDEFLKMGDIREESPQTIFKNLRPASPCISRGGCGDTSLAGEASPRPIVGGATTGKVAKALAGLFAEGVLEVGFLIPGELELSLQLSFSGDELHLGGEI